MFPGVHGARWVQPEAEIYEATAMSKKSSDERVQEFLDELQNVDIEKSVIVQQLRKMVIARYPKVNERMMYGGIMFSLEEDFGGLFVRKNHISFEFVNGFTMDDPKKRLEGTGKFRRHLKIRSWEDIKEKDVAFFVKQVI